MPDLLDVVELMVATGSWAAGTVGTVVDVTDVSVLVEINDDDGRTLDVVSLPHDALKRIDAPQQERLRF
jgi:Domain of unknown function (DUF4926)